jgi:hypothetical protein
MFDFLKRGKKTTVTAVNIRLHGQVHRLEGFESSKPVIEIRIPFKNKLRENMLTKAGVLKLGEQAPIKVEKMEVAEPFKLVSVEPKPPLEVGAGKEVEFLISVAVPEHNYTGPISVSIDSPSAEAVHIEISREFMSFKGKRVEVESSARMLNAQKGGIFTEKVQLYKAMSMGDTASSIELSPPFRLIKTEPALPATIDDPNSFIIQLFVQAPTQNYSGEMEINIA